MSETTPAVPPGEGGKAVKSTDPAADLGQVDWLRARRFLIFCGLVLAILVASGMLLVSLMVPLGISAFFTYLLLPTVDRLEARRVPRPVAVLAMIALAFFLVSIALSRMVPLVYSQIEMLVRLVPSATDTLVDKWLPQIEHYVANLGYFSADEVHDAFAGSAIMGRISSQLQGGLTGIWHTGSSLLGGVVNVVLIPVFSFFMLADFPKLSSAIEGLIPNDLRAPAAVVKQRVDLTLRSVIRGQVTVAAILTVLYVLGFSVIGLQSAIAIGVVAGIFRVIPYFDVLIGGTLSLIVILSSFSGWGQVLSVVLVFLIVQTVDGALVTPRVIGERVGLHPIVVIASVLVFGDWFGFWGVLVAIPVVAILKALMEAAAPYYLASRIYKPSSVDEQS